MRVIGITIAALFSSAISMGAQALDCSNIPAWNSATAYNGGAQVQDAGKAYTANWWSQGHVPANYSGQWQEWRLDGNCDLTNHNPAAVINVTTSNHLAGVLTVGFSAANSTDADGDALTYTWDFGDPTNTTWPNTATGVTVNHLYYKVATFTVTLTVTDGKGGSSTATKQVTTYCECSASARSGSSSSVPILSSSSVPSSTRPSSSAVTTSARSSSSIIDTSSSGNICTSAQFVSGTNYSVGQIVKNAGAEYRCTVAGWCSSTADWAYAPGTGTYWSTAWELVRSCSVNSVSSSSRFSSSSITTTSSSSKSASSSSTGTGRYHIISGYWHNFNNGSGVIPLDQVSDAFDFINISFAEPTGTAPGQIGFVLDPAFDKTQFKAAVKAKQAAGRKVIISIGGANGQVQLPTAAARATFVSSIEAIIDEYGFDGLDVDFEGHSLFLNSGDNDFRSPTTPVVVNLIGALQDLTNHYGSKFILTMAPETFFVQLGYSFYGGTCSGCDTRAGAYLPVIYALRDKLTALQVQNYNSGPITGLDNQYHNMGVADFHVAMIDMLLTGFKVAGTNLTFPALRQDQVLLGLPANGNAGGGFTSVAEVQSALNCLIKLQGCGSYQPHTTTGWKDLRGLMTWSINWDKFNNFEFSGQHRQYLDLLEHPIFW